MARTKLPQDLRRVSVAKPLRVGKAPRKQLMSKAVRKDVPGRVKKHHR